MYSWHDVMGMQVLYRWGLTWRCVQPYGVVSWASVLMGLVGTTSYILYKPYVSSNGLSWFATLGWLKWHILEKWNWLMNWSSTKQLETKRPSPGPATTLQDLCGVAERSAKLQTLQGVER